MKKILCLGESSRFDETGLSDWQIIRKAVNPGQFFLWEDCVKLCQGDPDAVLAGDNSLPPFLLGMEDFPCPTICYAVDTHIHSWLPWYGQGFDACLISLRDHIPLFSRHRGGRLDWDRLVWHPPCAETAREGDPVPSPDDPRRSLDCVFVGTIDPYTTPLRKKFFDILGQRIPITIHSGYYVPVFRRAKIVVNICEKGDLNFRVFESMGNRAALLTPRIGNGQEKLFNPGEHLQIFDVPGLMERCTPCAPDLGQAQVEQMAATAAANAEKAIAWLLQNEEARSNMAQKGYELINARHRPIHRGRSLQSLLDRIDAHSVATRRKEAAAIRQHFLKVVYLHWSEALKESPQGEAYLRAAQGKLGHF